MSENLKSQVKKINAKHQQEQELADCYELGKQAAWNNATTDNCPRYRKQNKIAAWLKGFADAQQEKQLQELNSQVDKAGIAKLKAVIQQTLKS